MATPKLAREHVLQRKGFRVEAFLGKGSFGSVRRVHRENDGRKYALKETDVASLSQEERQDVADEVRLLASVRHPNILAFHEAFVDGTRLCVVTEYAPLGDLSQLLKRREKQRRRLSESVVWSFSLQIARALEHLHACRIIHRDVKTANVMLTKPDEVKLGDFGVARLVKSQLATTQIGTPAFMAPEAWKGQPYDFSTDAFGLGCIMYEMVTFAVPFRGRTMNELRREIVMGRYQPLSRSSCSQALSSTISALLHPDAKKRLTPSSFLSSKPALERIHLLPNWEDFPKDDTAGVLETILVPRNLRYLQERLPWPKYPDDVEGCPPPSHGDSPCEMGFGNEKENHVDPMGVSNAQARKVVQAGRAEAAQGPPLAMPDNQLVKLGGRRNAEGNGNSELNDHPVQDAYERKRPQRDEMIKPLGRPTPCSPRPPFAVEEDLFERR